MSGKLKKACMERKEGGESQCQRVWHPGPLPLGATGSQRKPVTQEQRGRVCTLERPTGCSGVSRLDLGRAASQEVDATVQTQGDGNCDVSLGARHLQGRSRHLSVAPGSPASSGGSSWVLLWGTPLHHLAWKCGSPDARPGGADRIGSSWTWILGRWGLVFLDLNSTCPEEASPRSKPLLPSPWRAGAPGFPSLLPQASSLPLRASIPCGCHPSLPLTPLPSHPQLLDSALPPGSPSKGGSLTPGRQSEPWAPAPEGPSSMPHSHLSVFLPLQSCLLGCSQQAGAPSLSPWTPAPSWHVTGHLVFAE